MSSKFETINTAVYVSTSLAIAIFLVYWHSTPRYMPMPPNDDFKTATIIWHGVYTLDLPSAAPLEVPEMPPHLLEPATAAPLLSLPFPGQFTTGPITSRKDEECHVKLFLYDLPYSFSLLSEPGDKEESIDSAIFRTIRHHRCLTENPEEATYGIAPILIETMMRVSQNTTDLELGIPAMLQEMEQQPAYQILGKRSFVIVPSSVSPPSPLYLYLAQHNSWSVITSEISLYTRLSESDFSSLRESCRRHMVIPKLEQSLPVPITPFSSASPKHPFCVITSSSGAALSPAVLTGCIPVLICDSNCIYPFSNVFDYTPITTKEQLSSALLSENSNGGNGIFYVRLPVSMMSTATQFLKTLPMHTMIQLQKNLLNVQRWFIAPTAKGSLMLDAMFYDRSIIGNANFTEGQRIQCPV